MKNGRYEIDGNVYHFQDDEYHREDGPAIEYPNGSKSWWKQGKLHREDGPAIEWPSAKKWCLNGVLHREDGPAVEYISGNKEWWLNGLQHREDGPAVERVSFSPEYEEANEWYVFGAPMTEGEFNQWHAKKELNEKLQTNLPQKHHEKKNKI